jgi:aldehyde:ferredoxin oxidoreductase
MTRSPEPAPWIPGHAPIHGLVTHSSAGGLFPNMLKRAGFDQVVIDGRADRPVRLEAVDGRLRIVDAEEELFQTLAGRRTLRTASGITGFLAGKIKGGSTLCAGPAGWNLVDFACLTADHHRNFGRGGAGAVFGSKNLVAVTAFGREDAVSLADAERFKELGREIDRLVKESVDDPARTASFRPTTGTTWWLDRAFNGGYLGVKGGYLPWRNFDEGSFDENDYAKVSTDAFLAIAGKHAVCNKCRHIFCTRSAKVEAGPYAGRGVRPEFETIALWINCCILDRDAMFHMNRLCNELGVDTMTFGSVMAGAMEMAEKGFLSKFGSTLKFGDAPGMVRLLEEIAYRSSDLGRVLGNHTDRAVAEIAAAGRPSPGTSLIARRPPSPASATPASAPRPSPGCSRPTGPRTAAGATTPTPGPSRPRRAAFRPPPTWRPTSRKARRARPWSIRSGSAISSRPTSWPIRSCPSTKPSPGSSIRPRRSRPAAGGSTIWSAG